DRLYHQIPVFDPLSEASLGAVKQALDIRRVALLLLLLIGTTGCVRRSGRNADCAWPGGHVHELHADAEFGEELADRYALKMARRGDFQTFVRTRRQCLDHVFSEVAEEHGTTPMEVPRSLGTDRALTDLALNLPFVLLYALASAV